MSKTDVGDPRARIESIRHQSWLDGSSHALVDVTEMEWILDVAEAALVAAIDAKSREDLEMTTYGGRRVRAMLDLHERLYGRENENSHA